MNTPQLNWIEQIDPARLPEHEKVKAQWINTFSKIHKKSEAEAEAAYHKESLYWRKLVSADEKLKSCQKLSLYSAFMELADLGLSIQPGSKSQCYLESRGVKVGKDSTGKDQWGQLCYVRITAYGELDKRIASGQIIRMKNPVVIYDGDRFQPCTNSRGELTIDYKPCIPRQSSVITGCWVCIELPGGSLDFKWLLVDDIERLKKYATTKTQSGSYTNPLYTKENGGIDPGFLEAKTIKHAMRAYTRLKVGDNVVLEDDQEQDEDDAEDWVKQPFGEPLQPNTETVTFQINSDESF